MRLITGSPFPWCDVTETGPCCESLMLLQHAAKITCLLPSCVGAGLPMSPVLCRAVFPPEPSSSAPASPSPLRACPQGAGLTAASCPGAEVLARPGMAQHGMARHGLARYSRV